MEPLSAVYSVRVAGWGATSHFLKVEIDPAGGSAYTHLGTSELLSVPYAFHARTVEDDAAYIVLHFYDNCLVIHSSFPS